MRMKKLYYTDCHLKIFTAEVMSCEKTDRGWEICLDATAFYPEGGGQACDVGTLDSVRVLDVRERDEDIVHLCDGPLPVGSTVQGAVDWDRRFDLMQQHTGEHIVSGIVHRRYGYHNVGFHMGADVITIDFDGLIPQQDLAQIEQEANRKIWEDLPVRCWYPSEDELPQIPYRTKRPLPWPVRIVEIPEVDRCACCGVHVASTGEIGLVKLFSCVKFHQGVRIELACGSRALDILSRAYEQNRQVSQAFSAKPMETGEAARRMNEQLAAEKFRTVQLQRQIYGHIAKQYEGRTNVVHFEPGLVPAQVRELAEQIAQQCSGTAAVFCGDRDNFQMCLVNTHGDVGELGSTVVKTLNGRGGGKPGFFQGSVRTTEEAIREFFRTVWE